MRAAGRRSASGGGAGETAEVAGATGVGGGDDSLPFTGMGIVALVLAGAVLAGGGAMLRRSGGR